MSWPKGCSQPRLQRPESAAQALGGSPVTSARAVNGVTWEPGVNGTEAGHNFGTFFKELNPQRSIGNS